ncbi:hypothetical protein BG003_011149, partial [Podila horticola]
MIFLDIVDLTQRDRSRCTRVSKAWHRLCTPFLWHTVRPRSALQAKRLKDCVPHQALVWNLHLTYPEMREVFLPRLKILPSTNDPNIPNKDKDKDLYFTPCTNLRALHLQYVPIADWDSYKTE